MKTKIGKIMIGVVGLALTGTGLGLIIIGCIWLVN